MGLAIMTGYKGKKRPITRSTAQVDKEGTAKTTADTTWTVPNDTQTLTNSPYDGCDA